MVAHGCQLSTLVDVALQKRKGTKKNGKKEKGRIRRVRRCEVEERVKNKLKKNVSTKMKRRVFQTENCEKRKGKEGE